MVFVRLHPLNVPVVTNTGFVDVVLNVLSQFPIEDFLSVFCGKYQMNHQKILIVTPMLVIIADVYCKSPVSML